MENEERKKKKVAQKPCHWKHAKRFVRHFGHVRVVAKTKRNEKKKH